MFKFNFTADDLELDNEANVEQQDDLDISKPLEKLSVAEDKLVPAGLLSLDSPEFLRGLPTSIHYEMARIPFKQTCSATTTEPRAGQDVQSGQGFVTLYKRNLEDVKFQMALEDDDLGSSAEAGESMDKAEKEPNETVTGPGGLEMLALADKSDLVKGVYEGGLKTWECALDLVAYLAEHPESYDGKKVLELGCGSALPGIYVLSKSETVHVDFQDYNDQVLRLVTLPNILLNTCTRPDLQPAQPEEEEDSEEEKEMKQEKPEGDEGEDAEEEEDDDGELEMPEKDPNDFQGTELDLPAAEDEKRALLERVQAQSKLIRGDWAGFVGLMGIHEENDAIKYDLILTSETIYAEENHQKLYQTIKQSLKKGGKAFVAAKSFYFGVGGDILSFQRLIEKDGVFNVRSVFSAQAFVRREILELTFKQ